METKVVAINSLPLPTNERIQLIDRATVVVELLGNTLFADENGSTTRQYLPEERQAYKCALQFLAREFAIGARDDRPISIQTELSNGPPALTNTAPSDEQEEEEAVY
jgi:hypothetical protein